MGAVSGRQYGSLDHGPSEKALTMGTARRAVKPKLQPMNLEWNK